MVSFALQKLLSLVRSHVIGWIVKCTHTYSMGGASHILEQSGKESTCRCRRCRFNPWVEKIPWGRKWQPIPVFLPGNLHGQMSLVSYSPRGGKELNTTDDWACIHTTQHTHLGLYPLTCSYISLLIAWRLFKNSEQRELWNTWWSRI